MSEIKNYLQLITHNSKLLDLLTSTYPEHLENEDFSDWKVTILFYMSCVYIKAVFCLFGIDIQDHYTLRQLINTRKELNLIAKPYRHIEEASRDARYEGRKFANQYIVERLLPKFNAVRDCANGLFKQHKILDIPTIDVEPFFKK